MTGTSFQASIMQAIKENRFFETLHDLLINNYDQRSHLRQVLIQLHNQEQIDLVSRFQSLNVTNKDFWLLKHLFEESLPDLNCSVQPVLDCITHLFSETPNDLAAGLIFKHYEDYLKVDPERSILAWELVKAAPEMYQHLIVSTLVAGSHHNNGLFLSEAISASRQESSELRNRSVYAIGRLIDDETMVPVAISALEQLIEEDKSDGFQANLIWSSSACLLRDQNCEARSLSLIEKALTLGDEVTLHNVFAVLRTHYKQLPSSFVNLLDTQLKKIKGQNVGTIEMLDSGIAEMLRSGQLDLALSWLERILLNNADQLSTKNFKSTSHELILNSNKTLNKLVTRWFIIGEPILCKFVSNVISEIRGAEIGLEVDLDELGINKSLDSFVAARKTVGYLFLKPVSAASFLLSVMRSTKDEELLQDLVKMLFDPLLINYPGKVKVYCEEQASKQEGVIEDRIRGVLEQLENYLENLSSIPKIAALDPSESQKEAYWRYRNHQMAEAYKASEDETSGLMSLVSKSVILYGRSSVDYVKDPDGSSRRVEIQLNEHRTEWEIARMIHIDPVGLEFEQRRYMFERKIDETDS